MAVLFRLTDFQSKVLLFQRESQILTARQGTCPARRVLPCTRNRSVLFRHDTLAGVASEILGAQGRGRSESRTNFLGGPPICGVTRISPPFDRWAQNPPTTELSMAQPRTVSAPKKRREGGRLKHSCPSMISLVRGNPLRGPRASIG